MRITAWNRVGATREMYHPLRQDSVTSPKVSVSVYGYATRVDRDQAAGYVYTNLKRVCDVTEFKKKAYLNDFLFLQGFNDKTFVLRHNIEAYCAERYSLYSVRYVKCSASNKHVRLQQAWSPTQPCTYEIAK